MSGSESEEDRPPDLSRWSKLSARSRQARLNQRSMSSEEARAQVLRVERAAMETAERSGDRRTPFVIDPVERQGFGMWLAHHYPGVGSNTEFQDPPRFRELLEAYRKTLQSDLDSVRAE